MFHNWIEKTYRKRISFSSEIYQKVIKGQLSDKDIELMALITEANKPIFEEE